MIKEEEIFGITPFSIGAIEKQKHLLYLLNKLCQYHIHHSSAYKNILNAYGITKIAAQSFEDLPYLSIRLFKENHLMSVPEHEVIKVLRSSGTTGQKPAQIYLDKTTAAFQSKALVSIMQDFIGRQRLPMLIFDSKETIQAQQQLSARGAGILGFANFGRDHTYALDSRMNIDLERIHYFLEKHHDEKILMFGFTFIIWKQVIQALQELNSPLSCKHGILIHGGGWKKLQQEAVDNEQFKRKIQQWLGVSTIHNYYGLVEQVGSIFMECSQGHLHCPIYSNVLIRDPITLELLPRKTPGIIELMSILPNSYPGHILLTEDLGEIIGEDDCPCGRKGVYFHVFGRIANAEPRGCSDTYDAR